MAPVRRSVSRFAATFRTLRFKATVAVASLVVMISLLLSTIFVLSVERVQRAAAFEEAAGRARLLARDVAGPLADGDTARIESALENAVRSAPVVFANVSTPVFAVAERTRDCPGDLAAALRSLPRTQDGVDAATYGRESAHGLRVVGVVAIVESAEPGGTAAGAVRLGYSLEPTLARALELRWRAAGIALAMILFGTVGTALLVGGLIGPIQDLARATQRVADGDFEIHMESSSDDEIGVLTASFLEMTSRLRHARDRRESWNRELENRVLEKTREIQETRRHLENVVESVGASVIVADLDGTIVSANSTTTKIFGIKAEWIVGRSLQEFTCDPDRTVAGLRALLEGGGTVVYEAAFLLDENRSMDLLVTHTLLHDPDGRAAGILQITKDITPLKTMERRLVDTERLSAMGEMAGEIGHELNNYLTAIGGRAELVPLALEKGNYDLVRANSTIIAEQVGRMRVLTDGLLDSSRKETSPREIDLNDILRRTVEFVRPQNRYNEIRIEVAESNSALIVYADPQQLTQVILNLLANAADAVNSKGSGGGTIRVESFRREGEAGFRIVDEGVGIDEKTLGRIFEPRFTTKDSGNGFGLAVCHRVVRNHGGEISVNSAPGRGSTFTITLPERPSSVVSPRTPLPTPARP